MNIKQKVRTKIGQMNLSSNFVGVNRFFILVFSSKDVNPKRLKT